MLIRPNVAPKSDFGAKNPQMHMVVIMALVLAIHRIKSDLPPANQLEAFGDDAFSGDEKMGASAVSPSGGSEGASLRFC